PGEHALAWPASPILCVPRCHAVVSSPHVQRLASLAPGFVATFKGFSVEALVAKLCGGGLAARPTGLTHHDNGLAAISPAPLGRRRAVGTSRGSDLNSSSLRTSTIAGAPGRPTRRASCRTVISVGEGMAASTSKEDLDAIFQPRPYGVIAVDPLT